MTPPVDLLVRVEAVFPGATVRRDQRRGDWLITPSAPVQICGLVVATVNCDGSGKCEAYRIALTPSGIQLVGQGHLLKSGVIDELMQSVTAHDLIAARLRLGL